MSAPQIATAAGERESARTDAAAAPGARRWPAVATAALMLLLPTSYFVALAHYGLNIDDEGTLLYQIYRTYLGQLLYVDFHAGYTPGLFYWNAALFALFGVNVVVLRLCLAVVNGLTVYSMYWLARRLGASALSACLPGLIFVAFIPFYDGQFAAFNIPYPIWYVTLFWLLSVMCVVRWWERGGGAWWLPAGLCVGVVFAFKPNSGLLNLAALLIGLVLLERPLSDDRSARNRLARLLLLGEAALRWVIPLGLTLALAMLFGRGAGRREVELFALPLIAVVGYQLLAPAARRMARPVPAFTLWTNLVLLGVGFAAVTLPWTVYFWMRLGTRPFLRAVLFIGTGFDRFYYISYPPIGVWGVAFAAGVAAAIAVGVLLRRRVLSPGAVIGAFGAAAAFSAFWLWRHPPPMVEGFQSSVAMRVRDVALVAVLACEWAAVVAYVVQTWRGRVFSVALRPDAGLASRAGMARAAAMPGVLALLVLSAILMHMQLYPRTDFMHLVTASPGVLILGGWLLELLTQAWARGLARTPAGRRAVAVAVMLPLYALVAILIAPALGRIGYLARAWWSKDPVATVTLDNSRAPLTVEPAAASHLAALASTAQYLRAHSRPDDAVFTFPMLDMLCLLADRPNPTRHGYFFPGWPGHDVEAEVIDALQARPPRFVVTAHYHPLYFDQAAVYYFNLRRYITSHYQFERRIGPFDILGPVRGAGDRPAAAPEDAELFAQTLRQFEAELKHTSGATARTVGAVLTGLRAPTPWELADVLGTLDPPEQRLLAELIRKSRSPVGAVALAMTLENYLVLGTTHELFIRTIAEVGDARVVAPLLGWLENAGPLDRAAIAGLLFTIGGKLNVEEYWYAPANREELATIGRRLDAQRLIGWIDNPFELFALRSFAVDVAAAGRDRSMLPTLARVLGDPNEYMELRLAAAGRLVKLGFGELIAPAIIDRLQSEQLFAPALAASVYPHNSELARDQLMEAMLDSRDELRSTAYWVAAGVRDPGLTEVLQDGLGDRLPEVRMAAAWALGNLGDPGNLRALQRAANDPDDRVAAFARRAVGKLGVKSKE